MAETTNAHNAAEWTCSCGAINPGASFFCMECGKKNPAGLKSDVQIPNAIPDAPEWDCGCGTHNPGAAHFCFHCGARRPDPNATKRLPVQEPAPNNAEQERELVRITYSKLNPDIASLAFFGDASAAEAILIPLMRVLTENGNSLNATAAEFCRDIYLNIWMAKQNGQTTESVRQGVMNQFFFLSPKVVDKMINICDAFLYTRGLM